jgi:hypothetical protein
MDDSARSVQAEVTRLFFGQKQRNAAVFTGYSQPAGAP